MRKIDVDRVVGEVIRGRLDGDPGLTAPALIGRTGIPRATYYRKVEGHGSFNVDELVKIADYLGMTPGELMTAVDALLVGVAS